MTNNTPLFLVACLSMVMAPVFVTIVLYRPLITQRWGQSYYHFRH